MLEGSLIRAVNLSFYSVYIPFVMFVIFSVHASTGGAVTTKGVFTILSLLTFVRFTSIHLFVLGVLMVSEGIVALKRIKVTLMERGYTSLNVL